MTAGADVETAVRVDDLELVILVAVDILGGLEQVIPLDGSPKSRGSSGQGNAHTG